MVESFSEDDEDENKLAEDAPSEIRELLTRKVELERKQRSQELHRQRVKVSSIKSPLFDLPLSELQLF